MTSIRPSCTVAGLLAMLVTCMSFAQGIVESNAGGTPYVTGGVGEDERAQVEAAAKGYNMKLVFAEADGAFVADVQVTIKSDDGQTVLSAVSKGPLFFAKLPAGTYTVEATYRGETKEGSASIDKTGQRVLDFRW